MRLLTTFAFVCTVLVVPSALQADTVYLKNGSSIDGTVLGTHEGVVILRIGNVGRTEIPEKDIENIEKNDRTGYVDPGRATARKNEKINKADEEAEDEEQPRRLDESEPEIDPDVEKEIKELAEDLTRQKTTYRVRAERKLAAMGPVVVPYLVKFSRHPFVRTRVAVYRLLKKHGTFDAARSCIEGLEDEDRFVRQLAWQALKKISGKSWRFPWDDETATDRQRERAAKRWRVWFEREQERLAVEEEARLVEGEPAVDEEPEGRRKKRKSRSDD
jgi:hypothetical protein